MARKTQIAAMLLTLAVMACEPAGGPEATEAPASPLVGAWNLVGSQVAAADGTATVNTPQESLFLFTSDGHYSMAYAVGETASGVFADAWAPTDAEGLERWSGLTVNAGRYELSGSQVVLVPEFALYPVVMNSRATIEFEISGNDLTLTYVDFVGSDGSQPPGVPEGGQTVLRLVKQD